MSLSPRRLFLLFCGICLQLDNCFMEDISTLLVTNSTSSWIDAYKDIPDSSYQLISPFLAEELLTELRSLTKGPIYVNGFTYGSLGLGVVIQESNKSREFNIYCRTADSTSYSNVPGRYTFLSGKRHCRDNNEPLYPDIKFMARLSEAFWKTVYWSDDIFVEKLFEDNQTKHCMLLDLDEGKLMLENCTNSHLAVYVQDRYLATIKRYTEGSSYSFYDPSKHNPDTTTTTSTGTDGPSSSTLSTEKHLSYKPTKQHGENRTDKPTRDQPGTTKSNTIQDIFGMNPDIFYALIGVGSVVLVFIIICVCCCCKKRSSTTRSRTVLSDDYSNPVDSVVMKEAELNSNSYNGVYANPQDSISPIKAKKRDSIGEGVYDVTSISGQRKPSTTVNNDKPTNAYAHVTIQPPGGAATDGTENLYDSAAIVKPQQKVQISPSHSDHTYGEVKIKMDT